MENSYFSAFKKLALSLGVVVLFLLYSLYEKGALRDDDVVVSPLARAVTSIPAVTQTQTPIPSPTVENTPASSPPTPTETPKIQGQYRDGQYTGNSVFAFYGDVQVKAIISGGKLTDVQFLQYPNDRDRSIEINNYATPQLRSQAIQAQSAHVDGVSGATDTSNAFIESLNSALSQAKI